MTFTRILSPVALACLVSACAQQPMASAPPPAMAGQCNAAGAQFALGGSANAALVEDVQSINRERQTLLPAWGVSGLQVDFVGPVQATL